MYAIWGLARGLWKGVGEQPRSESTEQYVSWILMQISIWHDFNSLDLHHSGCDAYENENFCFIVVSITVPLQMWKGRNDLQ